MDVDEELLHKFGTPLEPLAEDEIPAKKPIAIQDQIVTDENGKRRFHGAFTGGFSAGFWNTVGSLEGWTPSEFKSSRSDKAPQRLQQRPQDFMDDEDLGEFGIAPQRIQAKSDFQIDNDVSGSSGVNRKRKLMQPSSGPIPGVPVLAQLLRPVEDKIAVRILKSMGWKPGQGIGPRLTRKEKNKARQRNKREEYIMRRYGCGGDDDESLALPGSEMDQNCTSDGGSDSDDDDITFAPDDYEPFLCEPKTNRFGMGYVGLSRDGGNDDRASRPQHINLFGPLEVLGKNNKKLSIAGQAFGVGAMEDEDEDIYARDDMSKYDFSLEGKSKSKKKTEKHVQDRHIVEGFTAAKQAPQVQKPFIVELPRDYQPRNWGMRKSRFAPLAPEREQELSAANAYKKAGLGRHDLNPAQRGDLLEEQPKPECIAPAPQDVEKPSLDALQKAQKAREQRTKALLERISAKGDIFTRGGVINVDGTEVAVETEVTEMERVKTALEQEQKHLLAKASSKTSNIASTATDSSNFKPFLNNAAKQKRYEVFLNAGLINDAEISAFLATIQPIELSDWDREMEKNEFVQARNLYKPLGGIMSERFISETTSDAKTAHAIKGAEKQDEADNKIVTERTKEMWKPCALLCKRYNIAEPYGGNMEDEHNKQKQKAKISIFEYLETSINTKKDFQTPLIIPKHIEKPRALIDSRQVVTATMNDLPSSSTASLQAEATTPTTTATIPTKTTAIPTTTTSTPLATIEPKYFKLPPKAELEKRSEESRDKPIAEKIELFRAIFEDSDDDDDSVGQTVKSSAEPELKNEKLQLPNANKPLTAAAANLLRNNSPPRGIFAALFNTKRTTAEEKQEEQAAVAATNIIAPPSKHVAQLNSAHPKITFKSRSERQDTLPKDVEDDIYGPKIAANIRPQQQQLVGTTTTSPVIDSRLLELFEKHKSSTVVKDVWVERTVAANNADDSEDTSSSDSSSSNHSEKLKKKSKKKKKNSEATEEKKKKKKKNAKKHSKKKSKMKKKKKAK